jgi:hypothetical protein
LGMEKDASRYQPSAAMAGFVPAVMKSWLPPEDVSERACSLLFRSGVLLSTR